MTNTAITTKSAEHGTDARRSANAQSILELAISVIDERGEAGIRVQELSDEVGVAITTLYRFFGSRDGLIEAAQIERYRRQLLSDVERLSIGMDLCRDADDFRTVLDRTLERMLSPELRDQRLRRINALGSAQSRPALLHALAVAQDEVNRATAEVLEEARSRGWIREDLDLPSFAAWLSGLTCGRVLLELGPTSADDEKWNALTTTAVHAMLFEPAAAPPLRRLSGVR